jgi:hypothetical protein
LMKYCFFCSVMLRGRASYVKEILSTTAVVYHLICATFPDSCRLLTPPTNVWCWAFIRIDDYEWN